MYFIYSSPEPNQHKRYIKLSELAKKYTVVIIVLAVFISLGIRLYDLQIKSQSEYGMKSEKNSIRKIIESPPRGLMYDRNGVLLVDNEPSYVLTIIPKKFDRNNLPEIASLIEESPEDISAMLDEQTGTNRFNPLRIKRDISFKVVSFIEENRDRLIGVDYQVESMRKYRSSIRGSHIFGYTREISQTQLSRDTGGYYQQGDVVGQTALEKFYEVKLRGNKGVKLASVDVNGKILGPYNEEKNDIKAINGADLHLTIDVELQGYAERLLGGRRGAIVAVDPRNGEVLCLVSKPDFDLSIFSGAGKDKELTQVFNDPNNPLFNRVIQTRYPPGSTWKMMMGAAGVGSGKITTTSTIACGGSYTFGNRTFGDHGAYGNISLARALEVSANVYFYKLGVMVGIDDYNKFGKEFGFGLKTGIDLPNETKGLLPSREYFDKVYGEGKWGQGLLVSLGIGQGELGVSPIQLVCYTAAIAMDGMYHQPHLVRKIKNPTNNFEETPDYYKRQINLPKSLFETLRRGMYLVVNGGGTAKNIRSSQYVLAGKTGTAQTTKANNHSWFVGFAPYNDPQIAVCVLGENQGWGNEFAAPLAAAIMIRYLSNNSSDVYEEMKSGEVVQD